MIEKKNLQLETILQKYVKLYLTKEIVGNAYVFQRKGTNQSYFENIIRESNRTNGITQGGAK